MRDSRRGELYRRPTRRPLARRPLARRPYRRARPCLAVRPGLRVPRAGSSRRPILRPARRMADFVPAFVSTAVAAVFLATVVAVAAALGDRDDVATARGPAPTSSTTLPVVTPTSRPQPVPSDDRFLRTGDGM